LENIEPLYQAIIACIVVINNDLAFVLTPIITLMKSSAGGDEDELELDKKEKCFGEIFE